MASRNRFVLSCFRPKVSNRIHLPKDLRLCRYSTVPKKENIFTIPNMLTMSRISMTPVIGYFILEHCYLEAFITLGIASFTDVLDGYIARKYKQTTYFGSALDPMADKILMTTLVTTMSAVDLIPVSLGALIIGRDIGLIAATAFVRYKSLEPPRYFDVSLPSAEVRPPLISKINTFLQLGLMGASLAAPVFGFGSNVLMDILRAAVAVTTVWSGAYYVLNKNVIRVVGKDWRS